jgi:RluA family pseudouridine synthase
VRKDEHVIVVDKPAGLAVQATREAGGALDEQLMQAHPEARLFHRIDRDTSGLVLFTRTRAARQRLTADLAAGRIRREYVAVVDGIPAASFTVDAAIEGRPAATKVRLVRAAATCALVECELVTGRTHQIRIHLAGVRHPILGDRAHAPPAVAERAPRLALHAARLAWPGGSARSPVPPEIAALVE